ncbi:hypothetical protein [Nocardia cyriacigeorgica]|uniref:hypothetical protein n=1 Tax=Nocardia cyriacigeorgica TaxID=135487 RepID=UPI0018950CCC|nr:hypothetical protein [Nocardia cyriacigeorgica]MBF6289865.1 hypothetical protein [Nocardia cyriacigeorgica]
MSRPRHHWHGALAEEAAAECPASGPITVLRDPGDTMAVTHALLDAHDPARGVITVHPTPTTVSGLALVGDTLHALGRSPARATPEQVTSIDAVSRAVLAWIRADRVRYLVVLRAHSLTADQLAWLLRIRRVAVLRLVLVRYSTHPIRWGPIEVAQLLHRCTDDLAALVDSLAAVRPAVPLATAAGEDLPRVPHTDVRTFLADAQDDLSGAQFACVDAAYTAAIETTCGWIAEHTGQRCDHRRSRRGAGVWFGAEDAELADRMLGRVNGPNALARVFGPRREDYVADWREILTLYRLLGEVIADSAGPHTTVTRLRGVQAAFALHGITLPLPPNLAYCVGLGLTTTPVTQEVIDRIRTRTANPAHAAAVAVQLFTGATVEELKAIPCQSYVGDALIFSNPVVCGHSLCVWVIPLAARPLVDAARIFQETRPKPATKLLVGGVGSYGQQLRATITAAGLTVPARHIWNHGWMWQTGMLWRGEHPLSRRKRKPHRRNPVPPVTFQRTASQSDLVSIEELVYREPWRDCGMDGSSWWSMPRGPESRV